MKDFAIGQHVDVSGRIHVVLSGYTPQYGGSYLTRPIQQFIEQNSDLVPHHVQVWIVHELTEARLCRKRTAEHYCTCGCIHVHPDYVIEGGRR